MKEITKIHKLDLPLNLANLKNRFDYLDYFLKI